jgi:NAD(P)H-nitrite reductase large subunit
VEDVVVVGASLAGFRAVEELRHRGYDGRLTVIGAEPHLPYDRPPLSKQILAGTWDVDRLPLTPIGKEVADLDVQWRLGQSATRLDPAKPARDQGHQLIEQDPPTGGVYAVASGHRVIIGRRHNPA